MRRPEISLKKKIKNKKKSAPLASVKPASEKGEKGDISLIIYIRREKKDLYVYEYICLAVWCCVCACD